MAEKRRLQQEIDKVLKRIDDGLQGFEDVYNKVQEAQTASQKDKQEMELKREIKKLQRLRDQLKAWQSSPEIKDKGPLDEARKKIEKEMERFKVCERELKIKAFSKEGLAQREKNQDPAEVERDRHRKWIRDTLETLATEIDSAEAELEALDNKKTKRDAEEMRRTSERVSRHKWHTGKLELLLRRLENETVELDALEELRHLVDYYVESNMDDDFYFDDQFYAALDTAEEIEGDDLSDALKSSNESPRDSVSVRLRSDSDDVEGTLLLGVSADVEAPTALQELVPEVELIAPNKNEEPSDPILTAYKDLFGALDSKDASNISRVYQKACEGFENLPGLFETRWRSVSPLTARWGNPIPSFPNRPIEHFDYPEFFAGLDTGCLVFISLYQNGVAQQQALRELKNKGLRFRLVSGGWVINPPEEDNPSFFLEE